jgi:hypothetical protein
VRLTAFVLLRHERNQHLDSEPVQLKALSGVTRKQNPNPDATGFLPLDSAARARAVVLIRFPFPR